MALFGKKKDVKKEKAAEAPKVDVSKALPSDYDLTSVIVGPRITEKSVSQSENNVYTFNVRKDANKFAIRNAIKALYNVTPVKINTVTKKPAKRLVGSRNKMKHVPGSKKAYVYLKKGDTINLV